MRILALFAGLPKSLSAQGTGEWWDAAWESGIFKEPVNGPVWLSYRGLKGDAQADLKNHGGPDKAVCAYPAAHYRYWRERAGLADLPWGGFGENATLEAALETDICIGDRFELGKAVVEVSQPRQPCWKLAWRWRAQDLKEQVQRTGLTGFYLRVIRHGFIQSGDTGRLTERPWPQWTVAECNAVMHHRLADREAALRLSECPQLSASWKDKLFARATERAPG